MKEIKTMSYESLASDYISLYSRYIGKDGITDELNHIVSKLEMEENYGIKLKKNVDRLKMGIIQKRTLYTSSIVDNKFFEKSL